MLQKKLKTLGDGICLAACYYRISHGEGEPFSHFLSWLSLAIEIDCVSEDGFVNNPDLLIGRQVHKSDTNNTEKPQIARFYNPRTGYSHFVIAEPDGKVLFDPLGESITVKEGYIKDWRIIE